MLVADRRPSRLGQRSGEDVHRLAWDQPPAHPARVPFPRSTRPEPQTHPYALLLRKSDPARSAREPRPTVKQLLGRKRQASGGTRQPLQHRHDGAERWHASPRVPPIASTGRPGYWLELLVALVVVAVAQRRLGPSSSATTSTTDREVPSSAVQDRCWSRPIITTRLPLLSDSAACSAWSRHTMTVKNDGSCSRRPDTATRNLARAIPASVCRSSGSSVRLPAKLTAASVMMLPSWIAWPGGLPCPWTRGTVDTVAC